MPRLLKSRTRTTEERAKQAGRVRQRVYTQWHDPYPNVHGTLPEKMVYAALSARRIPFLFLNDLNFKIPEIDFDKSFQADFVIPSLKLIIEVQGAYFHSMPKTQEADAFKFAIYEYAGYRPLAWWDFDIIRDVNALFAAEPAFAGLSALGTGSSELPVQTRTKVDTSKGIRTLNRKRGQRLAYKKKPITSKGSRIKTGVRV